MKNSKKVRFWSSLAFIVILAGLLLNVGYQVYQIENWFQEVDDD